MEIDGICFIQRKRFKYDLKSWISIEIIESLRVSI